MQKTLKYLLVQRKRISQQFAIDKKYEDFTNFTQSYLLSLYTENAWRVIAEWKLDHNRG